jgi:polysaccharide biosynthesis/export protein
MWLFTIRTNIVQFFILFSLLTGQSMRSSDLDPGLIEQLINSGVDITQFNVGNIPDTDNLQSEILNQRDSSSLQIESVLDDTKKVVENIVNSDAVVNPPLKNIIKKDSSDFFNQRSLSGNIFLSDEMVENMQSEVFQNFKTKNQNDKKLANYFGYNIFKTNPEIFQKSKFDLVDPGYVIGPGDDLKIMIWGETEKNNSYIVSKDGYLFIRNIGQVFVNGLTLDKLEKKLLKLFKKVYATLDNSNDQAKTFLDVSLGSASLRPIRIFVFGDVDEPGAYNVSSGTSLFNSLFYFNGPNISGSLRDIKLIRNNKEIGSADLYEFLLKGKQSEEFRLMNNDIIFIPPRGKTVRTVGSINKQKYFELAKDEGLIDLIKIAGNLTATTYMKRVSIDRIIKPEDRISGQGSRINLDLNLSLIFEIKNNFQLFDNDIINFFDINNDYSNVVEIIGPVNRPGRYELTSGMRLVDLIKKAENLLGDSYTEKIEIVRLNDDLTKSILIFNLDSAYENNINHNILLKSNDLVKIFSKNEMIFQEKVYIQGHVKFPGEKDFFPDMNVFDLVMQGGGFENEKHLKNTYFERAELSIFDFDGSLIDFVTFRLDSVLNKSGIADRKIKMGSKIKIYSYEEVYGLPPNSVEISGFVNNPGVYNFTEGLRISDLLFIGGGLKNDDRFRRTFNDRADLFRLNKDGLSTDVISFNLKTVLKTNDNNSNIALRPGDKIKVYSIDNYIKKKTVTINGSILSPGTYDLKNKMTLYDLIIEANGVDADIYSFIVDISKVNFSVNNRGDEEYFKVKRIEIDNTLDLFINKKTEKNIYLEDNDFITLRPKLKKIETKIVRIEGAVRFPGNYTLINNSEKVSSIISRAGGVLNQGYPIASDFERNGINIKLSFDKLIKYPNSKYNFILQAGDIIKINRRPNIVTVEGEVKNPGTFTYIEGHRYKDYLKMAGGYKNGASRVGSFVKSPDGSASSVTWFRRSPAVSDGSTLVILSKEAYEPFDLTAYLTSLTTIYSNLSQAYLMIILAGR